MKNIKRYAWVPALALAIYAFASLAGAVSAGAKECNSQGLPAGCTPAPSPTPTVSPSTSPGANCSHGVNDDGTCREDPNDHGQDCEAHGNENPAGNDGNEDHCLPVETTSPSTTPPTTPPTIPPTTPPPTETPSVTPPSPVCRGSVQLGPWHGDPLINITLTGSGSFVVKGGKLRRSNVHIVRVVLGCNETTIIRRYHVMVGRTVRVYLDGVLVASSTAPALNS